MTFLLAFLDLILNLLRIIIVVFAPNGVHFFLDEYGLVKFDLFHDLYQCLLGFDPFLFVAAEGPGQFVNRVVPSRLRRVHWERTAVVLLLLDEFFAGKGFTDLAPLLILLFEVGARESEKFPRLNNRDEPLKFLL